MRRALAFATLLLIAWAGVSGAARAADSGSADLTVTSPAQQPWAGALALRNLVFADIQA